MLRLVVYFVALATVAMVASSQILSAEKFENLPQADVIFTENLLFATSSTRSKIQCGMLCGIESSCVTFTFTKDAQGSRSCRGHDSAMGPGSPVSVMPGTQAYQVAGTAPPPPTTTTPPPTTTTSPPPTTTTPPPTTTTSPPPTTTTTLPPTTTTTPPTTTTTPPTTTTTPPPTTTTTPPPTTTTTPPTTTTTPPPTTTTTPPPTTTTPPPTTTTTTPPLTTTTTTPPPTTTTTTRPPPTTTTPQGSCPPCQTPFDDETTSGEWRVVLRRCNGCENFNRTWAEYQAGFGNPQGEFWFGLENLSTVTNSGAFEVKFDLEQFTGATGFAQTANIVVGPASTNYTLSVGAWVGGNVTDWLHNNNGKQFSTWDVDNDTKSPTSCARERIGAWWFWSCSEMNPNSQYLTTETCPASYACIYWWGFGPTSYTALRTVQMKVRPMV